MYHAGKFLDVYAMRTFLMSSDPRVLLIKLIKRTSWVSVRRVRVR